MMCVRRCRPAPEEEPWKVWHSPRPKSAARPRCRVVGTAWYSFGECGAGNQGTVRDLTLVHDCCALKIWVAMLQWALAAGCPAVPAPCPPRALMHGTSPGALSVG